MILRPYKRIKELEGKISKLEDICIDYWKLKREKEERLRKEEEGLHRPTNSCEGCKNFIKSSYGYYCKLDCKCEDRQEKE